MLSQTARSAGKLRANPVDCTAQELSRFIANSRINAKIDKVGGVVETNRPDAKNALYQVTLSV